SLAPPWEPAGWRAICVPGNRTPRSVSTSSSSCSSSETSRRMAAMCEDLQRPWIGDVFRRLRTRRTMRFCCACKEGATAGASVLTASRIERPPARATCRDEQEDEAVQRGQLPLVLDRQQRARAVRHPIGESHLAARDERRPAGDEPEHDEHAADKLEEAADVDDERKRA